MGAALLALFAGLLTLALFLLLLSTLILLLQICAAVSSSGGRASAAPLPATLARPRLAVLMPAHNESGGILAALKSIVPQLAVRDRLLVVADNCTDNTAALARSAGVEVVERSDAQLRGKGYALDHGVRHLSADPPEVVVIIDADCTLGPQCLDRLASACGEATRPVQALYLMRSPPSAGLQTRLAEFAWVMKNLARPLGSMRLGLPTHLMGSGMAFPWLLISVVPLASGHIVEDLELGLDLAAAGAPPLFCPDAVVWSSFPADQDAMATQRTRWEHGHLSAIASRAPRLLWNALTHGQISLVALVLDLCVPPLAFLSLLLALALVAAGVLWVAGPSLPLLLAVGATALFGLAIFLAWWRFGREILSMKELFDVPAYVLAKVPLYARFFRRRQTEWVRTERDHSEP